MSAKVGKSRQTARPRVKATSILMAAAVFAVAIAIAGCGSTSTSATTSGGSGDSSVTIGLAQSGPPNDHAFAQAVHEGAEQAQKELGFSLTEIDNLTTPARQEAALLNLARGNELVMFDDTFAVNGIPEQFPDTQFLAQNGILEGGPNTHSQVMDWWPVSYLAGVVAAHETKSNVLGYISGASGKDDVQAGLGYTAGAESVDPAIKVVRTSTGSYTDPVKGKAAAEAEIAEGADVIYSALDTAHQGLVQAAKDSGGDVRVIGALDSRCEVSEGLDIGDSLVDLQRMTYEAMKTFAETGSLPRVLSHGLEEGYSHFEFCPGEATPELKAAVAEAKAALLSGAVKP